MTISHRRVTYRNGRGQEIVGVLSVPDDRRWHGVVYLVPGFERQLYHYGPVSESFCRHGFATLRTDLTNHRGASEGEMRHFTLASAADDMTSVVSQLTAAGEPVVVVPSSLSARSAVRALAEHQLASGLVLLLPVVDVDYTVKRASVSQWNLDKWRDGTVTDPTTLVLIVEHEIEANFARAAIEEGWCGIDSVRSEIAQIKAPVVAICARQDDWVRAEDVEQALSAPGAGPRQVVILESTSHQLTKNPIAVRLLIESLLTTIEQIAELDARPIVHLEFEQVVSTVRRERRWAKSKYHDLSEEESASVSTQGSSQGVHP